jgi:hypothetical protein
MAKRFAGFTPEQLGKIVPEMQGMQGDEQAKFLAANPAAAARVGKMAETAQKRIGMAYGGMVKPKGYATGGQVTLDAAQQKYADAQNALTAAQQNLAANPEDQTLVDAVGKAQAAVTSASTAVQQAQAAMTATDSKSLTEMQAGATSDPMSMVTQGQVTTEGTGQAGSAPQATATTATSAPDAAAPTVTPAATTTAATAEQGVQQVMDNTQAAQGTVSEDAQVQAAQGDTSQLSQLGLEAAQGEAAKVEGAPTRTLDQAELISGSTVDQTKVGEAFGTGEVKAASVRDEMASLMSDFQGTEPPAWAAGAMRNAAAQMAARGLGASSMAGQAIIQAAMESALPIAQIDASNKQQMALFKAEQRAKFMGMEFDQNFQTKVMNAAKISEIANMNFTAEQQVALENAKMAQTMNLANLSNRQAKVMADAATMAQMDLTNLNNRQQAQVQNAKAFLDMDMANLSNQQQTAIFKAQQMTSTLLSDAAAENASRQFNASSQNQTDQFFANLASQVDRFNTEQNNQMSRFNAGEANAITQFNATQKAAREQFNSNNQLVIAQANAQWFQSITTAETAAQNQMNRDAAIQASKMTETAYNSAVQMERDTISYAFRAGESQAEREVEITLQGMRNEMESDRIQAEIDKSRGSGWGTIFNTIVDAAAKKIFAVR